MSQEIDGVDYGPLTLLVGAWRGDKGMDVAPEPDGEEQSPYYESLVFEASIRIQDETLPFFPVPGTLAPNLETMID